MIHSEMIDALFDLDGEYLPADYPALLWDELVRHFPALGEHESVGVIPLRTSISAEGLLLPRRSKLALRLPPMLAEQLDLLSGKLLDIGSCQLKLGAGKLRQIQHYPTLHAQTVTGAGDEVQFLQEVEDSLAKYGIKGHLLCGMKNTLAAQGRTISGYSLVIHDLKADDSRRLQYTGLGADRRYGCGIFVPYKVITDLTG